MASFVTLVEIQVAYRAPDISDYPRAYMRINFRCFGAGVTEQLLYVAQIRSVFQQVRSEAVPERMDAAEFRHAGPGAGVVEYF